MRTGNEDVVAPSKLKDTLIGRVSDNVGIPSSIVEKVVSFQFKDAVSQIRTKDQIEISGFGKFVLSAPKMRRKKATLERRITRYIDTICNSDNPSLYPGIEEKLKGTKSTMNYLDTRLQRYEDRL